MRVRSAPFFFARVREFVKEMRRSPLIFAHNTEILRLTDISFTQQGVFDII